MLRNKIKIIALIILVIISLSTPIVKAENEVEAQTTTTDQVDPISENENQEAITIKDGDEYLFQDTVTIDTPVDGNLFIIANTVTINSQVGGDAFICANTINIEENAYILSNVFASANTINMKGVVYNIYSIGDTLTIDGFVYRDVRSICNTLNINSMIGRNVFANCSSINFKEKTESSSSIASYGNIQGNLNYYSDEEVTIPEGSVSGETNFTSLKNNSVNISNYMYSLGAILVSAVILWLIGLWISPKLLHNTITPINLKKVLKIIGLGILVPLIITLLSIIILLIPITSQFTILLLCILAILLFISTSVTIININTGICNKLKINQNLYTLGFLIVTTIIFWLLTLIPYLGFVISLLAVIWGIGSISYALLLKDSSNENVSNSELKEFENKKENNTDEIGKVTENNKPNKTEKKEARKITKDTQSKKNKNK